MKIRSKWGKGYEPIDKSATVKSFFEKYCPIKYLLIIFGILLFIHLFLKFYIKSRNNSSLNNISQKYNILNPISEPLEIVYQNVSLSELDSNELKDINNFIKNKKLLNPDETFEKYENPKISIIIPLYSAEKTIEKSLLSIYNQDLKEIEVIIIDDFSTDKTLDKIKELSEKFPSISIYNNQKNKGILYSKVLGILNSKGKYILFLYQNDFFTKSNAFTLLYEQAEKNNLDILGFSSLLNDGKHLHHFDEIPLITEKKKNEIMYKITKEDINRNGDVIFNYFIKSGVLKNIVKSIDDKYLEQNIINYNSDFFLLYLLEKNVTNFMQIKNVLYYSSHDWNKKWEESELNMRCFNYFYYIEFLFNKTNDNYDGKRIVLYELQNWILNTKCRKYELIRDETARIAKFLADKKYIPNNYKKELFLYLFENVTSISNL